MDEYFKKVKLIFEVDKDSKDKVKEELDELSKQEVEAKDKPDDEQEIVSLKKLFKDSSDDFFDKFDFISSDFKKVSKEFNTSFQAGAAAIVVMALNKLANLFSDAWDELGEMLDYSRLSSQKTRDLAFTYGFDASQSYAYSKAMDVMGLQSEEDIFYMNEAERQQFYDSFNKYSQKYDELYDSGFFDTMREYEIEMAEFKEDMKLEVVSFFMENKDTIKAGMQAMMSAAEVLLKIFGWLMQYGGEDVKSESSRAADTSQIISNYKGGNTVNAKVDNTYNISNQTQADWATDVGRTQFQQILAVFN